MEAEKIIFSDEQIERYSKAGDGLIDFTKLNMSFKILWLFKINVGEILEKYDKEGFEKVLELINTLAGDGKISDELIELFKAIFENIDSSDETNLAEVVVDFILSKIDGINDTLKATVKAVILSVVSQLGDFLDELNTEIDSLVLKAE